MITAVRLITPQDVAKNYGQSLGSVYVLAHRKKWQRIKWQGRVYYNLDEVDDALGQDIGGKSSG